MTEDSRTPTGTAPGSGPDDWAIAVEVKDTRGDPVHLVFVCFDEVDSLSSTEQADQLIDELFRTGRGEAAPKKLTHYNSFHGVMINPLAEEDSDQPLAVELNASADGRKEDAALLRRACQDRFSTSAATLRHERIFLLVDKLDGEGPGRDYSTLPLSQEALAKQLFETLVGHGVDLLDDVFVMHFDEDTAVHLHRVWDSAVESKRSLYAGVDAAASQQGSDAADEPSEAPVNRWEQAEALLREQFGADAAQAAQMADELYDRNGEERSGTAGQ